MGLAAHLLLVFNDLGLRCKRRNDRDLLKAFYYPTLVKTCLSQFYVIDIGTLILNNDEGHTVTIKERPVRQDIKTERETVDFADLSRIADAINSTDKPVVIYFDGMRGIEDYFKDLPGVINRTNGHRLIVRFYHENFLGEQDVELPDQGFVALVGPVFGFDSQRLGESLKRVDRLENCKLVILAPEWKSVPTQFAYLEKWADEKSARRFEIDPKSVPALSREEVLKLVPKPNNLGV